MIVISVFPFIIAMIGLLMYALATNPKTAEIGRIMFSCGLLVLTFALAKKVFQFG